MKISTTFHLAVIQFQTSKKCGGSKMRFVDGKKRKKSGMNEYVPRSRFHYTKNHDFLISSNINGCPQYLNM